MKRRCVPLRADHDLLTPDTHTLSGVRLHPVVVVRSEGGVSSSGHLLFSSDSAVSSSRRHSAASPTRRLRFEDETETEAESRYLERQRQRRRGGQRGTGVLVSKPDLNLYVNGRAGAGPQGAGHVADRQQRGRDAGGAGQCDSCHSSLPEDRGRSLCRPRISLRTEPIRETYIGSVTPAETKRGGGGAGRVPNNQVRTTTNQVKLNGNRTTSPQATPTIDMPINPYAPDPQAPPTSKCPSPLSPPSVTSSMMSQSTRLGGTQAEQNVQQEAPSAGTLDVRRKNSSSGRSSETPAENQAPPTSGSSSHGNKPMKADDTSLPASLISRNEPSRLSLRRLFSTVRLGRTRAGSLDRLSSRLPSSMFDTPPTDPGPRKSLGLLKKTPSAQSLSVGPSSTQSFASEQKKKKDRSADYRPAADQFMQRCFSIEDVGRPSSVRSVGRVLEVCSDGTFLLEISRPKSRMYGFIISRGKGRPDSGVYVEDMVDSSTEKLYAGLLAVGDEILEVNGEKVACLSLDQVTHSLTQNASATVRVLRNWRRSPW
ncbi:uncharacterized protein LOC131977819 [Centropristis striata]|uniref:uncharacterized protein LOC131977819 n=1 Tax=Centropristis striata TaxID=184440 RepID=UPI0027DEB634|nr:uncharacterized protein LOC131977819 [Centropristis striata]